MNISRIQRITLNCTCLFLACLHMKWNVAGFQVEGIVRAALNRS